MSKGAAREHVTSQKWTRFILPTYYWLVIAYLCSPIVVMILFGFNNVPGRVNAKWYGFTLEWYRNLTSVSGLTHALFTTLGIAVVATLIATVIGALLGLAMGRYRFIGAALVGFVIFLAISSPEIVDGSAQLVWFVRLSKIGIGPFHPFALGIPTILWAHVMFCVSFVAITVRARVAGLDGSLEEAAQDLFATPVQTFTKVTLPLIMPGVMAGALLAFALSIDDFVITSFVRGHAVTFPVWVYGSAKSGIPPQVNVMGTLLFLGGIAAASVSFLLPKFSEWRGDRRLERERQERAHPGQPARVG
jgi:spermidine/putrescine transport system permease protein